jgi:hypothetical protein
MNRWLFPLGLLIGVGIGCSDHTVDTRPGSPVAEAYYHQFSRGVSVHLVKGKDGEWVCGMFLADGTYYAAILRKIR